MMEPLSRFATSTSPSGEGEIKQLAPLLFGMSGVVLFVTCLNLANMLLARGTARRKEIAALVLAAAALLATWLPAGAPHGSARWQRCAQNSLSEDYFFSSTFRT